MATILVVEYDWAIRHLLRILFELQGHIVVEVHELLSRWDSAAAIHDRVVGAAPDLVVTDMMTGGSSAWELIEHLRADSGTVRIPILAMSTLPHHSITTRRDPGADAFLSKPFDPDHLLEVVHALIERAPRASA
jgi:DNA-binding response OmpR family regulator